MQRKRKGNDRQAYQSHIKRQEAYERGWLDDADEEYPDYGEADSLRVPGSQRAHSVCLEFHILRAQLRS